MDTPASRVKSELSGGDPALLNKLAWSRRWIDRNASVEYAETAQKAAKAGAGRRSRTQQGMSLRTIAWQARWRGQLDQAMTACLSAEAFLPENDHPEARSFIYGILGSIHFARNRFDLAASSVERGFWLINKESGENSRTAMTELLLTRATVQRHTGESARAGITLGRAQELANTDDSPGVEYCTATWLLADGDADGARARGISAMEAANQNGNRLILPYLHGLIAVCDSRLARIEEALENLKVGLQIAEEDDDLRVQCFLNRYYAQIERDLGNLDSAKLYFEKAAKLAKTQNHAFERKRIALGRAKLFERMGQYKKAVEQHNLAWRLQNETRLS